MRQRPTHRPPGAAGQYVESFWQLPVATMARPSSAPLSFSPLAPSLLALLVALASLPFWVTTAVAQTGAQTGDNPAVSRTKAPPRLPATPAQQARIPSGVDTGTPATSDTMPLGLAVPPTASADQRMLREESAAARAAARRKATPTAPVSPSAAGAVTTPTAESAKSAASAATPAKPRKQPAKKPAA